MGCNPLARLREQREGGLDLFAVTGRHEGIELCAQV